MCQQVPECDGHPVIGNLRNVLSHIVVERELPFENEQHDGCSRELFRKRPALEDGVGGVWDSVLQIGHPISSGQHDEPMLRHAHRTTRAIDRIPALKDAINLEVGVGPCLAGSGRRSCEQPDRDDEQ
jgi:hypothetical protein